MHTKNRTIILLFFFVLLCALTASAQFLIVSQDAPITTQAPQLKITLLNQDPDPVRPGQIVEVRFKVENKAQDTADELELELLPSTPFTIYSGTAQRNLGLVRAAQSGRDAFIVTWKLKVDELAAEGEHDLQLRYRLKGQGWIRSDEDEFSVEIRDATPSVIVKEAQWTPADALPGRNIQLRLVLENKGQSPISNVKATLDLTGSPLIPQGASNVKYAGRIAGGSTESIDFSFVTLPDAKAKAYNLPLSLSYDDREGVQRNASSVLGILVVVPPDLDVFVQQNKLGLLGETGSVIMQVVNKGITNVRFVTLTLQEGPFDVLSPASLYLGDIDSDDFETAEFKLHTRNEPKIPFRFTLSYTDANNNKVQQTIEREVILYEKTAAVALGLSEEAKNGWYVTGGVVLAGLVVYLIVRRSVRRRA